MRLRFLYGVLDKKQFSLNLKWNKLSTIYKGLSIDFFLQIIYNHYKEFLNLGLRRKRIW